MTVHLYFDIDGVLNPYHHRPGAVADAWDDYRDPHFLVTTSPKMIARLNHIIATYDVRCFWLTSWEEQAPWYGQQVGLDGSDQWEWLPALSARASEGEWQKFDSIRQHIADTRPALALWMEDDLLADPAPAKWAEETPGVEAFVPDPSVGLSPLTLDRIEDLIRQKQEGEQP